MVMPAKSTSAQGFNPVIFAGLLRQYREASPSDTPQRWLLLEAAHVVGQPRFKSHLETHVLMLRLALQTRDGGEVAGQILRLLLVPCFDITTVMSRIQNISFDKPLQSMNESSQAPSSGKTRPPGQRNGSRVCGQASTDKVAD